MTGTEFENQDLSGARFTDVDLSDATFRSVAFHGVAMRDVEFSRATIDGEVKSLVVNGVEVAAFVEAELDRRHPERPLFRPADADGLRSAWDVNERLWAQTVDRARRLPEERLHESVDEEWSFIQTLRHLAFGSQAWVGRGIRRDPSPWQPLSLPWDPTSHLEGLPHGRDDRPPLEVALALRLGAMAIVRGVIDGITDEQLDVPGDPLVGPGWPAEGAVLTPRTCLQVVLNEEWWHRQYAERDLGILEGRSAEG